jgi:hypothetical protein
VWFRIFALGLGLLLVLGIVEIGLRIFTKEHRGGKRILWIPLLPHTLPDCPVEPFGEPDGYITYDPDCGWAPRPFGRSPNGLYFADQWGLRADRAAERTPPEHDIRIMLAGDSFAHSDEVPYADSLARAVETRIPGAWVQCAGVPAYGTDQAWLRYRKLAPALEPDVVIIGVHPGDFRRNVSPFSHDYRQGEAGRYSKPRFVPDGEGGFRLFNRPAIRGRAYLELFEDLDSTVYAKRSHLHVEGAFERKWYDFIRLARFLRSRAVYREHMELSRASRHRPQDGEFHSVTRYIVEGFAREVRDRGGLPIVVVLPASWNVEDLRAGDTWWRETLRRGAELDGTPVVDLAELFSERAERDSFDPVELYTRGGKGHFNARGNRLAAELLLPSLEAAVERVREARPPR